MTVTTRVRHLIEVVAAFGTAPIVFDFESHDIGCTQGTTIRHNGAVIAQYKPGTRYWDTALELAEQTLAKAMEYAVHADGTWEITWLQWKLTELLDEKHCTPWDGHNPNQDQDEE